MKLELIKYNNANCLEATIINEDVVIYCQAYADVQMDLLKEDCLKYGVKLNKEQLALIKEVESNIILPNQEEIEAEKIKQFQIQFRYDRDILLAEIDIAISKAEDLGQDTKDLRVYRQALRDSAKDWIMPKEIF